MTYKNKYFAIGLLIVAATAYGAYAPTPPVSTAPTADELYQKELAIAQRICEKAKIIAAGSEPEITIEECLEENARCENQLGQNAVWTGPAPGGFPTCTCDEGYNWLNDDGTTGTSYGPGLTLDTISAPGRCVAQQ